MVQDEACTEGGSVCLLLSALLTECKTVEVGHSTPALFEAEAVPFYGDWQAAGAGRYGAG
jgi:hypothetical protein